jgi:ribosomal protein S18 acetylase RimI-like enzyme
MSAPIAYREITPADIPALFRVRVATWHNPNGAEEMTRMGITPESVRQVLATTHRGWLAERGGEVIGFAMGNRADGEMWVIAVLKPYEGRGVGRCLITQVEDWLFAEGWEEVWLTTDVEESFRAVGFYKRLGWTDWKFEHGDRYMKKRRPAAGTDSSAPIPSPPGGTV